MFCEEAGFLDSTGEEVSVSVAISRGTGPKRQSRSSAVSGGVGLLKTFN